MAIEYNNSFYFLDVSYFRRNQSQWLSIDSLVHFRNNLGLSLWVSTLLKMVKIIVQK